jgi:hypothetical protein
VGLIVGNLSFFIYLSSPFHDSDKLINEEKKKKSCSDAKQKREQEARPSSPPEKPARSFDLLPPGGGSLETRSKLAIPFHHENRSSPP